MALDGRWFDHRLSTLTIIATATAVACAVAALAYQPDLDPGHMALNIGTAAPISHSALERKTDQIPVNQLAVFLQQWTRTGNAAEAINGH